MKPFNLESAKAGKPVCTRDGRPVRILCFDARGDEPIVGLVHPHGSNYEAAASWHINGAFFKNFERDMDLFMADQPEEKAKTCELTTEALWAEIDRRDEERRGFIKRIETMTANHQAHEAALYLKIRTLEDAISGRSKAKPARRIKLIAEEPTTTGETKPVDVWLVLREGEKPEIEVIP